MVWSTPSGEVLIDIVTRAGQSDHGGHGGGALAYGGKPSGGVVPPQPRPPPAAPYAPQPYPPQLRLHQPGYGSAALSYRDSSYVRGGGAVGEYRSGSRMSLLGTAYLPPPAPSSHHPPPADPPPFKKIRLTAERAPPVTSLPHHQPLRVDTREPVSAYSTVEVLSPNPPSEPTIEDQNFRTTKDDLLQQISKVDREMLLSETTLNKLRKKHEELEQTASKPARAEEPEEAVPRHRSLAQCVYADNRKKATSAHGLLSHLGPPVLAPLYNQPQDTEVYHENIRRHRTFRRRLAEHIRRWKLEAEKREDALAEAYSRRAAEWLRRVERIEQGQKRKAKDARNREFFEKVFPELRKQREERERFNRLGARVKSEAELEEIADGLHEQEHEDKKMRSLTVVPPLLRDPADTTPVYKDTNRRCMDMEAEHKELQLRNVWSQAEREVFRDKYLQHPKNFGQIASFLPRKSVRDCVRFYYLSKKAENYKQLLRKPRQRRSARNPPRPAVEPELPAGVTTRLQRSQGTVGRGFGSEPGPVVPGAEGKDSCEEGGAAPPDPLTCIPVPLHPHRTELSRTPPLPPSPPPASSAPLAPVTSTPTSTSASAMSVPVTTPTSSQDSPRESTPPISETTAVTVTSADVSVTITAVTTSIPSSSTTSTPVCVVSCASPHATVAPSASPALLTPASTSAPPTPQPAQPPTPTQPPPTPETAVTERTTWSTAPTVTVTSTTVTTALPASTCAVCNNPGATRTVSRSRAVHYGLKEEMVGSLVCEACHGRCVVSRYPQCGVGNCSGARGRARRLRHLPPRWYDLPTDTRHQISTEMQIPQDLSKCCLACFKRITRRLEALGEGSEPTEEEAGRFRALLREYGTAWDRMAAHCSRLPASLKAFYYTYRKKLQLDSIISVASTSSSEHDSDTTSAPSPPRARPPGPPPRPSLAVRTRDEYDSSATETADEENDAPNTNKCPPAAPAPTPPASTAAPLPATSAAPLPAATPAAPPAPRNGPAPPQNVQDVMLNFIEISLTRDSNPVPPAIKPHTIKVSPSPLPRTESLATLSVVTSTHAASAPRSPRPATITPLSSSDDVMLLHIEPRQEPLLDLSVKRPRHDLYTHHNKLYRNSSEYQYRQPERESPNQYNSKPKPVSTPPRPTLKPTPAKGSITLGTPVETRFDSRRTPPEPKAGSITAGTPVHGTHHIQDKRGYDYFKRRSPGGPYYAATSQPRPQSPSFSPTASTAYSRSPYGMEQQRQIIITDFITSQQMHGPGRRGTERASSPAPPAPPAAPPGYYAAARREPVSVIQRHTPLYPHHHAHPAIDPAPPGQEAFLSLVDVASAATALPVPRGEPKPEPKPPPSHHQQHHDVRVNVRDKYHGPLQYQVVDRRVAPQYVDRERIHRHNSERAMAAMQERHHALVEQQHQQQQHQQQQHQQQQQQHQQQQQQQHQQQQHQQQQHQQQQHQHQQQQQQQHQQQQQQQQQQMLHESRQHHMQHQQAMNSEASRNATYNASKHRVPAAPHHIVERKDTRPPVPVAPQAAAGAAAAGAAGGGPRAEGTLTAASLIDAIITHQISQTSDQRFPANPLQRDEGPAPGPPGAPAPAPGAPPPPPCPGDRDDHPAAHTTSFKLGDLASNIITRDFASPTASSLLHNNRFSVPSSEGYPTATTGASSYSQTTTGAGAGAGAGQGQGQDEWKRRENPKHAPFLEPVSPPGNHHNRSSTTGTSASAPRHYVGAGGFTTAFDYVKTRIVEVMRSDGDDRTKQIPPFPTAYAFPYSALNVASAASGEATPAPAPAPAPAPVPPEPAPLMSAQYEPLSDED